MSKHEKPKHLTDFDDVVEVLGGAVAVAKLTGRAGRQSVSVWRTDGRRFPARTFRLLSSELAARGYSASMALWDFEEPPAHADGENTPAA